jgi:tetratricopeptide (TPR) repeat protein
MMRTRFAARKGGTDDPGECSIQHVCGSRENNNATDRARRAYEAGNFASALELYQEALRAAHPKNRAEISALLSNAAACRLQLLESASDNGGCSRRGDEEETSRDAPAMIDEEGVSQRSVHARAAVEEARRCVRLNPTWSSGYLRLAEALLASKGQSSSSSSSSNNKSCVSNEACNCLQTALRLDPNLHPARRLLQQELRRDHAVPVRRRVRFASSDSFEAHQGN